MSDKPGYGRSGRGAALLKALEQPPARKPGQQPSPSQPPQVPSLGRGIMGGARLGSITNLPPPAAEQPTQPHQPITPSHHTPSKDQNTPPVTMGRGAMLKQFMQPVRLPEASPPKVAHTPASSTSPPTGAMQELTVTATKVTPPKAAALSTGATKQGNSGNSALLGANYLSLKAKTEGVYQYAVHFSPPVESKYMRCGMLREHKDLTGETKAFDGSILFLPIKITDTSITRISKRATDNTDVTITITLTNILHHSDCLQLFNIIIRRVLRALELQQVGRQYYDHRNSIPVPQHKMEIWPGYVTAIHQYDGGLLLLLDVSHKLLRMDSALDFLYELYSTNKDKFQDEATRQLVGTVILTRYNNKTYRIDDIAWDKNPQSTFIDHTGKAISFVEYYKASYDKDIKDLGQPLLLHRPKKKMMGRKRGMADEPEEQVICLVPELCSMTGLTDKARNDFKVMKDLAVHTRITPNQREASIKKFLDAIKINPKAREELSLWGLELSRGILETKGRTLNPEKILFKDKTLSAGIEADWGREVVRQNIITSVPLKNWLIVFTKRDANKASDFMTMVKKVSPPMGIDVNNAIVVELTNDRTETYVRAIKEQINPSLQMVVIIFPTSRDDRYSSVKKLCCIENPIPSQVINARTISQQQKLRSVTQKIVLQINAKLGGELWALEIPLKNMMVIGIDVYHDSARGKRSILGFVSSTNHSLTRWYSRVSIQDANQEIADGLKLCLQSSLRKYHDDNHTLPERIVVFRDGVGDGQMATVSEFEVPQMKSCFSMFGEEYKPKLAVVVVQKRISTRIFARAGTGYENPAPGTILDHTVTRKGWYDFFLVSQHVRQGTVTPTHYNVVVDSSGLKPDHMQRLAYKLTHMYYNWPGTIRVPAPCQYAHKLAFLVGQSLHREPSQDICDRLFFL